jgi:NADH-quinone oxidoreductase subunit G
MKDLESADFILAAGLDAIQEAPMLAVAMRQAFRGGAVIGVLDPRPVSLPFAFRHIPVPPWEMDEALRAFMGEGIAASNADFAGSSCRESKEDLTFLRDRLRQSIRPMLVCSTSVISLTTPDTAADLTLSLRRAGKDAGLFYVLPGPNSYGAAWLSRDREGSFLQTVQAIEDGSVKALVVAEADLFRDFPDRPRLDAALQKLELLLVLDCLPTETAWRSHAFLPTTSIFESDASFANQEGRIQRAFAVHAPGLPIWQETGHRHPVREFRGEIPGGDPMPAWSILSDLHRELSQEKEPLPEPRRLIEADFPGLASAPAEELHAVGWRVVPESGAFPAESDGGSPSDEQSVAMKPSPDQFLLLLVEAAFGTEELSGYSPFLRKVEPEPRLWMHSADAAEMGFSEGETVHIATDGGPVAAALTLSQSMARSTLILPRHMQLDWQRFKGCTRLISRSGLSRAA